MAKIKEDKFDELSHNLEAMSSLMDEELKKKTYILVQERKKREEEIMFLENMYNELDK